MSKIAKETKMSVTANDLLARAWRLQMDAGAGMMEVLTKSASRMIEAQAKGNAQELWRVQNEYVSAVLEKSVAYWSEFSEIALAAQSSLVAQVAEQMRLPHARQSAAQTGQLALLDMMDSAYKRWLESTRQFYAPPAVAAPQVREPA